MQVENKADGKGMVIYSDVKQCLQCLYYVCESSADQHIQVLIWYIIVHSSIELKCSVLCHLLPRS